MSLFDLLLAGSGAVYTAAILWLLAGLRRGRAGASPRSTSTSIIVAARNEANSIESCLQALKRQDYQGRMEVVVIDDRSRDDTAARVLEQAREWPQLKLLRARENGPFRCPKKSALAQGIDASEGELLLFTDADCRPPPGWVRSTAAHFADDVGLVAGYACFRPGKSARLGLLALDNLAVAALSAGSVGMGHVLACTGRNMAYRRQVYEEVGGFGSIGHLIGGDDVYFARLVARRSRWRLAYNRRRRGRRSLQSRERRLGRLGATETAPCLQGRALPGIRPCPGRGGVSLPSSAAGRGRRDGIAGVMECSAPGRMGGAVPCGFYPAVELRPCARAQINRLFALAGASVHSLCSGVHGAGKAGLVPLEIVR